MRADGIGQEGPELRRKPRRPLVGLLLAIAGGTTLGLHGPNGPGLYAALVALALLAALAPTGVRALRERRIALHLLICACAALRAAAVRPAASAPASDEGAAGVAGRWAPEPGSSGAVGRLRGSPGTFELPPGAARAGELLLLAPSRESPRPAAGPPAAGLPSPRALPRPVLSDELVRVAPAPRAPWCALTDAFGRLRSRGLEQVTQLRDGATRGLAAALLFGDSSQFPTGLADLFTRTGTRHALSVSGLHVGLIAWIAVWPLASCLAFLWRALRPGPARPLAPEPWRALLLALFVPLAGGAAPVVRAALALSLALLAPALPARADDARRRPDALSLWALGAILECLASPNALSSLSLQLSYAGTLGLILGSRGAIEHLRGLLPSGGRVPATWRYGRPIPPALRILAQRALDLSIASLAVSLAANLATLPLTWMRFGEWSPAGILATPAILLPMALFLLAGWLWVVLPCAGLELALDLSGSAMVRLLVAFDALPATPACLPPRPAWLLFAVGAAGLLLLAASGPSSMSDLRRGLARAAAAASAVLLLPWTRAPARLELVALDVGHGTACVVRAPGAPCWIFDAGSRDRPAVARDALAPLLARWEVGRVAYCLSHADRDHDSALEWIQERYPARTWLGALSARRSERLPHGAERLDALSGETALFSAERGQPALELTLVRGGAFEGNEGSRCLALRWGAQRVLLCGDAEEQGLRSSLATTALEGPFDLVLQPHHGSDTPFLGRFLARTRPARVWISSAEVPPSTRELDRRGIPWSSTAVEGALVYPRERQREGCGERAAAEAARFVFHLPPHPMENPLATPARPP